MDWWSARPRVAILQAGRVDHRKCWELPIPALLPPTLLREPALLPPTGSLTEKGYFGEVANTFVVTLEFSGQLLLY